MINLSSCQEGDFVSKEWFLDVKLWEITTKMFNHRGRASITRYSICPA